MNTKFYPDARELPYMVSYARSSSRVQSLRFSDETQANTEIRRLLGRGHTVDLLLFSRRLGRYVAQATYTPITEEDLE